MPEVVSVTMVRSVLKYVRWVLGLGVLISFFGKRKRFFKVDAKIQVSILLVEGGHSALFFFCLFVCSFDSR